MAQAAHWCSTMAFRSADLQRIGGFAAVGDYLADDYQLGARITALGLRVAFADTVVETNLGSGSWRDVWKHQVTLFLRAKETFAGDPPTAYYRLFRLITKGLPTVAGVEMINATVHTSCYPMDLPSIERQTDSEGLDYFEVPLSFTEMGDD